MPWEPWRTPPVMFLHGEIDCREGILRAVDRLKYDSFPEALLATVGIYQALLQARTRMGCIGTFLVLSCTLCGEYCQGGVGVQNAVTSKDSFRMMHLRHQ